MKLKSYIPLIDSLDGDKEEPLVQVETKKPPITEERNLLTVTETTARQQRLMKKGLFMRAVVANITKHGDDIFDPHNWGIITSLEPLGRFPLIINWADGKQTRTTGDDVVVIYKGMIRRDMVAMLKDRIPINETEQVAH